MQKDKRGVCFENHTQQATQGAKTDLAYIQREKYVKSRTRRKEILSSNSQYF